MVQVTNLKNSPPMLLRREAGALLHLDLNLLEKVCSPAFQVAAACGGAYSTCWLTRVRSTGDKLLRRTPARSKMGRGLLGLLLSKIDPQRRDGDGARGGSEEEAAAAGGLHRLALAVDDSWRKKMRAKRVITLSGALNGATRKVMTTLTIPTNSSFSSNIRSQ
ncbi:unnamed protein product [Urochloa humidicola]